MRETESGGIIHGVNQIPVENEYHKDELRLWNGGQSCSQQPWMECTLFTPVSDSSG